MKNSTIALFAAMLLSLAACQKSEVPVSMPEEGNDEIAVEEQGRLVSASLKSVQDVGEALQQAVMTANQVGGEVLSDELETSIPLLKEGFFGTDWQLQIYRIVYNTVDIKGDPICLSGDVGFINEASGFVKRTLDAVTLFHCAFNTEELTTSLYELMAMPLRTLYNQVVVYPFYQGVDIDMGVHPVTVAEPVLKARQAIDCEIAALELLEQLGVALADDYYTANMGVSNGAATTLATQYLLETAPEYDKVNKELIRLKGTYCGEGCYSFRRLIPSLTAPEPEKKYSLLPDYLSMIKATAYVTCLTGTYDTWKGLNGHFQNVDDVRCFFSDEFLSLERPFWYEPLSVINILDQNLPRPEPDGYSGYIEMFRNGVLSMADELLFNTEIKVRDMINPELFDENGLVDMNHPYLIDIEEAMAENDIFLSGWNPRTPLQLSHSVADDFVNIGQVQEVYDELGNNGFNRNVRMTTVPGLDHLAGTFFFLVKDVIAKEVPWE